MHIRRGTNAVLDARTAVRLHRIMEMAFHQGCGEKLTEVQKRTRIRSGLKLQEQRIGTFLAVSLLLLLTSGGATLAQPPAAATTYNQVQVKVQTANALNATYIGTVYNSSASMEATSQTRSPVFTFALPSPTSLFAVTALQQSVSRCPLYDQYAKGGAAQGGPAMIYPPCFRSKPAIEYGYSFQQVTGSTSITISTQTIDKIPTSNVTITTSYLNGTAASGASVSAYIVGEWYWWGNSNNRLVLWGQTDKTGKVDLVVPSVPVEVSAWAWLPVNLPSHQTTVQTTVGGEKVNVTVYWQPTYVGLAGSALIMPPKTGASITLHAQQPNYWATPYGVQTMGAVGATSKTMGTIASAEGGIPAQQYSQYQYGPAAQTGVPQQYTPPVLTIPSSPSGSTDTAQSTSTLLAGATVAAVAIASISVVIAVRARKPVPG